MKKSDYSKQYEDDKKIIAAKNKAIEIENKANESFHEKFYKFFYQDTKQSAKGKSEAIGISRETIRRYINNITECGIGKLAVFAQYYNVSADYLLGLTERLNSDVGVNGAADLTGLKEDTICTLINFKELEDKKESTGTKKFYPKQEFIDFLLASSIFDTLINTIIEMVELRRDMKKASESQNINDEKKLEEMKQRMTELSGALTNLS